MNNPMKKLKKRTQYFTEELFKSAIKSVLAPAMLFAMCTDGFAYVMSVPQQQYMQQNNSQPQYQLNNYTPQNQQNNSQPQYQINNYPQQKQQNNSKPQYQLNNYPPQNQQNNSKPQYQLNNYPPQNQQNNSQPQYQINNYPPQNQQNNYQPQYQLNNYPPQNQQNNYQPQYQLNNYPPQNQQNNYPPQNQQNNYQPQNQINNYQPQNQLNNYPPQNQINNYQAQYRPAEPQSLFKRQADTISSVISFLVDNTHNNTAFSVRRINDINAYNRYIVQEINMVVDRMNQETNMIQDTAARLKSRQESLHDMFDIIDALSKEITTLSTIQNELYYNGRCGTNYDNTPFFGTILQQDRNKALADVQNLIRNASLYKRELASKYLELAKDNIFELDLSVIEQALDDRGCQINPVIEQTQAKKLAKIWADIYDNGCKAFLSISREQMLELVTKKSSETKQLKQRLSNMTEFSKKFSDMNIKFAKMVKKQANVAKNIIQAYNFSAKFLGELRLECERRDGVQPGKTSERFRSIWCADMP